MGERLGLGGEVAALTRSSKRSSQCFPACGEGQLANVDFASLILSSPCRMATFRNIMVDVALHCRLIVAI